MLFRPKSKAKVSSNYLNKSVNAPPSHIQLLLNYYAHKNNKYINSLIYL